MSIPVWCRSCSVTPASPPPPSTPTPPSHSRSADDRPLSAATRRDRGLRRVPRLRGRLSVGPWGGHAVVASACHRRHPGLPHRGAGRTSVALRPLQPRGVRLSFVQEPLLSQ